MNKLLAAFVVIGFFNLYSDLVKATQIEEWETVHEPPTQLVLHPLLALDAYARFFQAPPHSQYCLPDIGDLGYMGTIAGVIVIWPTSSAPYTVNPTGLPFESLFGIYQGHCYVEPSFMAREVRNFVWAAQVWNELIQ